MSLLELLEAIDRFQRAPITKQARFPTAASPYQPVLLLSLVRLFRRNERRGPVFTFAECKTEFRKLFEAMYGPQEEEKFASKVTQPFWVFGSGRSMAPIWTLVATAGNDVKLATELRSRKDPVKSEASLLKLVQHAELQPHVFELMRNQVAQQAIVSFTVWRYFPNPSDLVEQL